jgi:serralysin
MIPKERGKDLPMPVNYKGTSGKDVVYQNQNNDYFNIYTYGGNDIVNLTLANTYVVAGGGNDVVKSDIEGLNDVHLGEGDDTYIGNGFGNNTNRFDTVFGDAGEDKFTVMTNFSEYYGGTGDDTMSSAGYRNYLNGGDGNDTISYMAQDDDQFLRGKGVSVDLDGRFGFTGSDREETVVNFENVEGTSFGDSLRGDTNKNEIWGMSGFDLLDGRSNADKLYGVGGDDDLYGGEGKDQLNGGRGRDFLYGEQGTDSFIFASTNDSVKGADRDIIFDFRRSEGDRINLAGIDAIKGGGDDAFNFIGNQNFQNAGDLQYRNHILAGDVNGDGKADFEIEVRNVSQFQDSDFNL